MAQSESHRFKSRLKYMQKILRVGAREHCMPRLVNFNFVASAGIDSVGSADLLRRQARFGRLRPIFGKPSIAFESETLRLGAATDVEFQLHLKAEEKNRAISANHVSSRRIRLDGRF